MKDNYAMLFEEVTLAPWGGGIRRSDPFRLADADTFRLVDNSLDDGNGEDAKFILYAAIKKAKADRVNDDNVAEKMEKLQLQVWRAKTLNDLCVALTDTKQAFVEMGYIIIT